MIRPIEHITVTLDWGDKQIPVGELVLNKKKIYFKYHVSFLALGIDLSPFKLPLEDQLFTTEDQIFEGLYGVFADSLPDGWGRLLLDRKLASQGVNIRQISPLDRLAYIGGNGIGALTYHPKQTGSETDFNLIDLDQIAHEVHSVLEGESTEIIDDLVRIGGSPGGARPKIMIGYDPVNDHIIYGQENLPPNYEHWIIKFPSQTDLPDIAEVEMAYSEMAKKAGVEMEDCRLFTGKSGNHYFGTKRFDRDGNKRFHLHSAAGLLHDNFRYSNLDYGFIMDAAFRMEKDASVYDKVLRLAAFNVFSHNRDDHSKNFSFLMDEKGNWKFSPAYDLTYSSSSHGMHSTMIAGESAQPNGYHLLELGEIFSMDQKAVKRMIDEVHYATGNWSHFANQCGVSKQSTQLIDRVLKHLQKID